MLSAQQGAPRSLVNRSEPANGAEQNLLPAFLCFGQGWKRKRCPKPSTTRHEVILFHGIGTILAGGGRSDSWKERLLSSRGKRGGCSLLFSAGIWVKHG